MSEDNLFRPKQPVHPLMQHVIDSGALGQIPTNMMPAPQRPEPYQGQGFQRYNSPERKSSGFYGELGNRDNIVSEYSLGGDNGELQYPSIFPGMTGKQLQAVTTEAQGGARFPQSIADQAYNSAQDRLSEGKSPFWNADQDAQFQGGVANVFSDAVSPTPQFASGAPGTTISDAVTYSQAQSPVREATLRPYEPTWRDRLGAFVAGDSAPNSDRWNFAQGLVGSAGAGKHGVGPMGMSVLDVPSPATGFGLASPLLDVQASAQQGDTQGVKRAMVGIIPGANVEGKVASEAAGKAATGISKMMGEAVRPPYQRQLNDFGLYSFGAEQSYNLPQETGTVQQMRATLERLGVKPAEFQHSGFDAAFPNPNEKVNRDQLVQHFETNVPQLSETERSVSHGYPYTYGRDWQRAIDAAEREGNWQLAEDLNRAWEETEGSGSRNGSNTPPPKYAKYTLPGGSNYREITTTYTDGEALRLDRRRREIEALGRGATEDQKTEWADIMNRLRPDDRDLEGVERFHGFPQYTSGHWDGEKNILVHNRMKDRQIDPMQSVVDDIGDRMLQSIYPQGGVSVDNLGAGAAKAAVDRGAITPEEAATYSRIRGWQNDYIHQKGLEQRLLHSEETQSDWGQAAKDKGIKYPAEYDAARQNLAVASKNLSDLRDAIGKRMTALDPDGRFFDGMYRNDAAVEAEYNALLSNDPEYQRLSQQEGALTQAYEAADEAFNRAGKGVPPAPYIGNTGQWTQLGQKRALWEAAQNDADALVWNTGQTQADRYNLANQVSEISYDPRTNTLYAFDHDGRQVINQNTAPDKIKDYIGEAPAKALLERVNAAEWERQQWHIEQNPQSRRWEVYDPNGELLYASGGSPYDFDTEADAAQHIDWMLEDDRKQEFLSGHPSINGLDLQVGGEGMQSYYDQIYKSELKDLLKRAKVTRNPQFGTTNIKTDGEEWPYPVNIASDGDSYWLAGRNPRTDGDAEERLSANFKSYVDADTARERLYAGYNQPVHSLQLTPEMKDAIRKGLPYFALPGAAGLAAALQAAQGGYQQDESSGM